MRDESASMSLRMLPGTSFWLSHLTLVHCLKLACGSVGSHQYLFISLILPRPSDKLTSACHSREETLYLPHYKPLLTTPSRSKAGHWVTINQWLTANWFYTSVLVLANHNLKANLLHTFNIIGSLVSYLTKPELITVHHF